MITPEKLAEIIQDVKYHTEQDNMPPVNIPWSKLNHYDRSYAILIARQILEQIPKRDAEIYQDVENLKGLAYALKRALNEYYSEEE